MTSIKIGDTLTRAGATVAANFAQFVNAVKSNSFVMAYPSPPTGPLTPTSPVVAGYANVFQTKDVNGNPVFYWTNVNTEQEQYPTAAALAAGLGTGVISINAAGQIVIQPRLATPAEQATMHGYPGGDAALGDLKFISFAFCTFPLGLPMPFSFGWTRKSPNLLGAWPAAWVLQTNDAWPPEIDFDEEINPTGGAIQITNSIHTTDNAWEGGKGSDTFLVPGGDDGQFHDYDVVVYPDQIAMFRDGVCTNLWTVPADFKNSPWYPVFDYALSPGGWAGTEVSNTLPPLIISDIRAYAMPAVYGSGTLPVPAPTPTPLPVPVPAPAPSGIGIIIAPGVGTFKDGAGNVYTIDAASNAMMNGKAIANGDGTAAMVLFSGTVYGQDANVRADWYPLVNGLWGSVMTTLPWGSTTPAPTPAPVPIPIPVPVPTPTPAPVPSSGVTAAQIAAIVTAEAAAQTAQAQASTAIAAAQTAAAKVRTLLAALKPAS